jgi:outer membrane protein
MVSPESPLLSAVTSGQVALEASERNREFGTGSEFEVLSNQNNYYAALGAYNQARYDYLTSVLTLKQQAGRLDRRDLITVDDMLVRR